jgi:hypothetical protein
MVPSIASEKSPATSLGIDPQTFRLVAYVEKKIWSSEIKCCEEDPHQSRVDESVQRTGYCVRNQIRKIKMVRTCRKNVRRNNCETGV